MKNYVVGVFLSLSFLISPMVNATEGAGTIVEIMDCIDHGWNNTVFKLSDGQWFIHPSKYYTGSAGQHDNYLIPSLLQMAFVSNYQVEVKAEAQQTYCGITGYYIHNANGKYIKITKE